jgi:hypothetical protein
MAATLVASSVNHRRIARARAWLEARRRPDGVSNFEQSLLADLLLFTFRAASGYLVTRPLGQTALDPKRVFDRYRDITPRSMVGGRMAS